MDRDRIVDTLRAHLLGVPDIDAAWLFGSLARGDARATSDVDVAILTHAPRTGTLADLRVDLADELSRAVGRTVDLVIAERAPVDLVHRVLRDGVLFVERDRSARIRFEVDARNRYFDMLPVWRVTRREGLA